MDAPLTYLQQRVNEDWLIGYEAHQLTQFAEQLYSNLTKLSQHSTPPKIILASHHPVQFIAGLIAATTANCPIFLCNPDWVKAEWQQVFELVKPDIIWGLDEKFPLPSFPSPPLPLLPPSPIMIPTGGSSGKIRFAIHNWETLLASVQGFAQYFQTSKINSFCVLPLYHVSGLMQLIRSFTTGGNLVILPFKILEFDQKPEVNPAEFFISLVPTQLKRLLQQKPNWLSQFHTVLLGGAPAWSELLELARKQQIRLAPTYGMTETASQVVTLKPEDFLSGNNSCGQVLPHAKVTIQSLTDDPLGTVTIQANSLFLGYYPNLLDSKSTIFQPDDLGFFDRQGYLTIMGRNSNKIITGGENVFPQEVEAIIQATNLVLDVCVIGLLDDHWGQVVTAVYVPSSAEVTLEKLQQAIAINLSKFKRPKYWIAVEKMPRNSQGKVNSEAVKEIAIMWQQNRSKGATI